MSSRCNPPLRKRAIGAIGKQRRQSVPYRQCSGARGLAIFRSWEVAQGSWQAPERGERGARAYTLRSDSRCAVVTYNPQTRDITTEDTGAATETDKEFIYSTYNELLKDVAAKQGITKTEIYEERAKARFKKEPANMKLLIVVDKLLTGFDAPPCTYLYIDKSMQDHGLFQAICRTNRLDGDDKDFGYIVDYKDLFKKVENAIAVYTSELDRSDGSGVDPEILLQDRLKKGRERLDNALRSEERRV